MCQSRKHNIIGNAIFENNGRGLQSIFKDVVLPVHAQLLDHKTLLLGLKHNWFPGESFEGGDERLPNHLQQQREGGGEY